MYLCHALPSNPGGLEMYISENILKKNINETEQSVSDLYCKPYSLNKSFLQTVKTQKHLIRVCIVWKRKKNLQIKEFNKKKK